MRRRYAQTQICTKTPSCDNIEYSVSGNYSPLLQEGVHPLKLFSTPPLPQQRPPLAVLRVLKRTLIGSMLLSAIGTTAVA